MRHSFHAVKTAAESATLAHFGLRKQAGGFSDGMARLFTWRNPAPRIPGVLNALKWGGSHVAEMGRESIFGSPLSLVKQLQGYSDTGSGGLGSGGRLFKDFYLPKTHSKVEKVLLGLSLAGAAGDVYSASQTKNPDERRGEIAKAIAGLALAPITSRMGLAGVIANSALKGGVGKLVRKKQTPYTVTYDPLEHAKLTLRGSRAERSIPDFGLAP